MPAMSHLHAEPLNYLPGATCDLLNFDAHWQYGWKCSPNQTPWDVHMQSVPTAEGSKKSLALAECCQ